jgi:hypothetical protein
LNRNLNKRKSYSIAKANDKGVPLLALALLVGLVVKLNSCNNSEISF